MAFSPECAVSTDAADAAQIHRFDQIISFAQSRVGQWGDQTEMQKVCKDLETSRAAFHKEAHIIFVGACDAGKSTVINRLVGQEVCATGIGPTTNGLHGYPWSDCLLVDSSGLDTWHKPQYQQEALDMAQRSLRAVLVLNGHHPLAEEEVTILKQLVRVQSRITVAINYWKHLDTQKERDECMTYLRGCLKEIMPGVPVEVFHMNAMSGSDPGVQDLSHFLQSTVPDQKRVSADTAIHQAAQHMLDICKAQEVKEAENHEKKLQELDRKAVLSKYDALESELEALRQLEEHFRAGGMDFVAMGLACGAVVGALEGFDLNGVVSHSIGCGLVHLAQVSSVGTTGVRQMIQEHMEAKKQRIEVLRGEIENVARSRAEELEEFPEWTCFRQVENENTLQEQTEEKQQEIAAYKEKMDNFSSDKVQLQAFLLNAGGEI